MAKGRTSITERLKKNQKREARRKMAHEWADKWEQDYLTLLSQIKQAISKGHDDDLVDLFVDLRGLQQPKFEALHRVIDELITPTRQLIDNMELGYTPNNLKAVRQKHGLTQQAAADLLDINISALQRWESDINLKSHTDMPIKKWFELLSKL